MGTLYTSSSKNSSHSSSSASNMSTSSSCTRVSIDKLRVPHFIFYNSGRSNFIANADDFEPIPQTDTSCPIAKREHDIEALCQSKRGTESPATEHRVGWLSVFLSGVNPIGPVKWPVVFTWILAAMIFFVFSGELLWSKETSGEFLELEPFNIMIGPSIQILIQCGARYAPCMRNSTYMPPAQRYVCLNTTETLSLNQNGSLTLFNPAMNLREESTCSLQDICGMGGFKDAQMPDQAFRFITPLFVHTGLLHFSLNMAVLFILGPRIERRMNALRFGVLYIVSGIFGNVFGATFAPPTAPSLGCSSALFGLIACLFVDLGLRWHLVSQPWRHLVKLLFVAGK
ncbi:rhomboid family-domain-containing protein [Syncephalastrum racemosum]|uniref:Rhomboid family-domain-containing protein n=1 Tax=Syncephalastrum racemosum TaxID=13706 RepID=A0A1X2HSC2_SYNRA|nr:rhomboid family-domain-containing protein [Syncephalastrum racemosum]